MRPLFYLSLLYLAIASCSNPSAPEVTKESNPWGLKPFNAPSISQVMTLGTMHFNASFLDEEHQLGLDKLIESLKAYQPNKIILEWEPRLTERVNQRYRQYLGGIFSIDTLYNEVYQLGFRLAAELGHDQLYLFDDQTPFIGSLTDFSFDKFFEYDSDEEKVFVEKHLEEIKQTFEYNNNILESLPLYEQYQARNSPFMKRFNIDRMHMLELRKGVQSDWFGPDWVGRWYRRNTRMSANLLKLAEPGDKILIIVGDNHKWVLETLFDFIPEFTVVPAADYLK